MLGSWVPAAPINHLSSSKCRWSKKVSLNKVVLFLIYDKVWFLIKSINSVDELHCGYDKRIRGSKPSPVQIRIVSKMKVYLTKAVLLTSEKNHHRLGGQIMCFHLSLSYLCFHALGSLLSPNRFCGFSFSFFISSFSFVVVWTNLWLLILFVFFFFVHYFFDWWLKVCYYQTSIPLSQKILISQKKKSIMELSSC